MYIRRRFNFFRTIRFLIPVIIGMSIWATVVTAAFKHWQCTWLAIPALPVSILGTAVSFYLGFKGNSAYGRLWEARKIWGGIINSSRTWGTHVTGLVADASAHQELLYRHVAWLAALRIRLRRPKPWEHRKPLNDKYRKIYGTFDTSDERMAELMAPFLDEEELSWLMGRKNQATQLLYLQSQHLKRLFEAGQIDDFRHMELVGLIEEFFTLQGKCERIKNFPLPRQYATANHWFILCFLALIPLALLGTFFSANLPVWLTIPVSVLLSWIFYTWDVVVDFSENPFEGLINDIPMDALSRTIEIDLRDMLGESDLPPAVEAIEDTLM